MRKSLTILFFSVLISGIITTGCRTKGCTDPEASNYDSNAQVDDASCEYLDATEELRAEVMLQYADMVYFTYEDCYLEALELQTAVNSFVESPTADGLEECRDAWRNARRPFAQSEAFRFYEGPVDDVSPRLNEWLIDPSYVDYVSGSPFSGIIFDKENFKTIDQETLLDANQLGNKQNVSVGYHVIEFLLWGQDTAAPSSLTSGARSFTDFAESDSAASDKVRRSDYLKACTDILVADLATLVAEWSAVGVGNYRESFLGLNSTKGFRYILTGMVRLASTEMATNRLRTSLDSLDSEREVSRFSDNTSTDILLNAIGMRNIFDGKYTRIDSSVINGASVFDVASMLDDTLSIQLQSRLTEVVNACGLISAPFDYRLSEEFATPNSIENAAEALDQFSGKLVELGLELGYEIDPDIRNR